MKKILLISILINNLLCCSVKNAYVENLESLDYITQLLDEISQTPIILAEKSGNKKVIELLESNNIDAKDDKGNTALILATKRQDQQLAESLIENGANVNIQNDNGKTALMYASRFSMLSLVKKLMQYGADPELANDFNQKARDLTHTKKIILALIPKKKKKTHCIIL